MCTNLDIDIDKYMLQSLAELSKEELAEFCDDCSLSKFSTEFETWSDLATNIGEVFLNNLILTILQKVIEERETS